MLDYLYLRGVVVQQEGASPNRQGIWERQEVASWQNTDPSLHDAEFESILEQAMEMIGWDLYIHNFNMFWSQDQKSWAAVHVSEIYAVS